MAQHTLIACLTPPGKGAIATLAIRGPDAWRTVRDLFQFFASSGKSANARQLPEAPEPGRFWLGRLGQPGKGGSDEVVLSVRRAGPAPWLELHCHGGQEAIRLLMAVLAEQGIEACSWQELERRTADNPLQCLAQETLAQAPTVRTATILLDQYHGAFEEAINKIVTLLEEGEVAGGGKLLQELAALAPLGRHLVQPWKVVVAGPPNVGKSSLVNALAGFTRSLVSATPGTTRDVVTVTLAIDGWPVEVADTAGWRDSDQPLEREGMERARQAVREADLCLWLFDGSATPIFPKAGSANSCYVINKVDLSPAWNWDDLPEARRVSARTGEGLTEICQVLSKKLVPDPPDFATAVPFSLDLCDRIEKASNEWSSSRGEDIMDVLQAILVDPN